MERLSLRLRIFLFFALIALGALAITAAGLWIGASRAGEAGSGLVTAGLVAGFGITGLVALIWLLFDENVAKPVEALSAELRTRAHASTGRRIDTAIARYLGDLAPAADAISRELVSAKTEAEEKAEARCARLETERAHFVQLLSDMPQAVLMVNAADKIVLYDGQAAEILEKVSAPRLMGSIFDYFDRASITGALTGLEGRRDAVLKSLTGELHEARVRRLEDGGYTLVMQAEPGAATRPITYDLSLLDADLPEVLDRAPLKSLSFVVFDSETTGLNPMQDEVVQLAALRIVAGRIVAAERFDTLVNPGRPIPPASTKVHGVDDTMVADAPGAAEMTARFHAFCRDAVIVAHNAPFDMAFLHRYAKPLGLRFDNRVLDTVLMSAACFGGSATHTLDAVCERLDIEIPAHLRHTAMGDTEATAKAFLGMVEVLSGRGIDSFGGALDEMRKHTRILRDANDDMPAG